SIIRWNPGRGRVLLRALVRLLPRGRELGAGDDRLRQTLSLRARPGRGDGNPISPREERSLRPAAAAQLRRYRRGRGRRGGPRTHCRGGAMIVIPAIDLRDGRCVRLL